MNKKHIFHLAIPVDDLAKAKKFYVQGLGCSIGREYESNFIVNFFGEQLVCHLSPDKVDHNPSMYPRHFGLIFENREELERIHQMAKKNDLPFFQERFTRFEGKAGEHESFFLRDPASNLLEFKYYSNLESIV